MRRQLPSATVTFVFTDVEGSTRLLHELGAEAYAEALAEHRRVLRTVFAAEGGVEVDTQGDAFFYVFADARAAVAAAAAANAALEPGPIRIRLGLHTGKALLTGEGYVGEDVHLGARIAAAGHGGQVLLSAATRTLLDSSVTDLGEHRLKDFAGPVAIFQLGEKRFPPLKTISNTNLPRPASSFVGRERETAQVAELVRGHRLVTLSGPGGSGKTRLSIEAASELVGEFKAGVLWVSLAPVRDPTLVLETVGQTLAAKDGVADEIGERELLLLLDNLEQVVEVAPDLASLVEVCPNLHLLVTSRELLRVRGEVDYPVPPLAEPEAVTLFCERSGLDPDETIAELCRRLDNLPLAVELAAARTGVLTPPRILDRLAQRLDLLKGGRDAEARQHTLRATIEWSHDLLTDDEKQLFARLSVFAGSTLFAAEEIVAADVDGLQSLVDKSLVRRTGERFWMLETIGAFARERLAASNDADAVGRRHAEWFLALAEEAEPFLNGPEQSLWLQRLEDEHDNLRASLDWFFDHGDADGAVRLAGALWVFWYTHGHVTEARRWLRRALDTAPNESSEARARVLYGAGYLASEQNENEEALALLEASLASAKELGDTAGAAIAAATLCAIRADARSSTSDRQEALAAGEEAVALARAANDDFALAIALNNVGGVMRMLGENERATAYLEESLELRRRLGDVSRIALALYNLAEMALLEGGIDRAATLLTEAAEIATAIGDKRHVCFAHGGLGWVAYLERRLEDADRHARESLRLARELGQKLQMVAEISCLAGIAAATGDTMRTARLAAVAEVHYSRLALELTLADAGYHRADIERARTACSPEAWERASAEGLAMSLDEAADYALSSA
ncbi:MAG TPA: adenylate/guanylate cyclase domain-containing protein [Gaiellaceae bacterium]